MEQIEQTLQTKSNLLSYDLVSLLEARDAKKIDFVLVDVRESYEYNELSIIGCDYLLPTSELQHQGNVYETLKTKNVVLYCRTGNRTGQVMAMLQQAGLEHVSHLAGGIVSYQGATQKSAALPLNK